MMCNDIIRLLDIYPCLSPYQYAVTSGVPPPGLTLSTTGVLSGMATEDGSYSFTITATDSNTPVVKTGAMAYTIRVFSGTTTTFLESSLNPSTYDQSVTFTATVYRRGC